MCNRIHFKSSADADKVRSLLVMRGYRVSVLKCGCMYQDGAILELGDSAYEFALQIADAFELLASIEG